MSAFMTVMHAAQAAEAIYENADFDGHTMLGGFFDPKNDDRLGWKKEGDAGGGSGGIYRFNNGTNQFIVSFRGSKGGKDWKVDDVQIAFGLSVDRVSGCIAYIRQLQWQHPGAEFLIVGHSLGGFLAQVVGFECELPFITFNAPAAGRALAGSLAAPWYRKGVNLRVNWDPATRIVAGRHVGPLITIPHYGGNIFDAHMGAAVLRSMERASFRNDAAFDYIARQNSRASA